MDAHWCSRAYVCVCICVYVYISVHFLAVSVACILEQVFSSPVHVHVYTSHKSFLTSIYTLATHSLQGVHIRVHAYIYVYACICIWIHMCVCDVA